MRPWIRKSNLVPPHLAEGRLQIVRWPLDAPGPPTRRRYANPNGLPGEVANWLRVRAETSARSIRWRAFFVGQGRGRARSRSGRFRSWQSVTSSSREHFVQPVVDHGIRKRQVAELAVAVRSFRCCENALRHRSTHATTEALEQLHGDRTLALAHQSKARTADILKSIPDLKVAHAPKPGRQAIDTEATQRCREAELHARRHLLIGEAVNLLQAERRWVGGHLGADKTNQVGVQVWDRRVRHQCLDPTI